MQPRVGVGAQDLHAAAAVDDRLQLVGRDADPRERLRPAAANQRGRRRPRLRADHVHRAHDLWQRCRQPEESAAELHRHGRVPVDGGGLLERRPQRAAPRLAARAPQLRPFRWHTDARCFAARRYAVEAVAQVAVLQVVDHKQHVCSFRQAGRRDVHALGRAACRIVSHQLDVRAAETHAEEASAKCHHQSGKQRLFARHGTA